MAARFWSCASCVAVPGCAVALLFLGAPQGAAQADSTRVSIRGRAIDARTGTGAAGATIVLTRGRDTVAQATADTDGIFRR